MLKIHNKELAENTIIPYSELILLSISHFSNIKILTEPLTAISVIVATYMGNSGVEKMATAKYQANKIVNREDDGDGAG